jgi:uncharacterized protein with GYD domain
MPKYLLHGSYTPEGVEGLVSEGGSGRVEAARQALGSVGGTLEGFYFALGEDDFYTIVDVPDTATVAAVSMAGNVAGGFSIKTVALLTPEEMDEVVKMTVDFRPPGR